MSEQSVLRSPQVVSKELDISPATLRRWSEEFKDHLSDEATIGGQRSHRRYVDDDVSTLIVIKELMNDGMTYEQVRNKLNGQSPAVTVEPDDIVPDSELPVNSDDEIVASAPNDTLFEDVVDTAIVAPNSAESPAIAFLTNTLTTLSDSQKSILNSQAANRELMGVLLQDNFNLKEENNRLRDRILEVERDVAQNRQDEEWRREALRQEIEAKVSATNKLATEAITVAHSVESPELKAVESNPGCLGMFMGKGGTKIITMPRRKKTEGSGAGQLPSASSSPSTHPVPPSHPKPLFPPE